LEVLVRDGKNFFLVPSSILKIQIVSADMSMIITHCEKKSFYPTQTDPCQNLASASGAVGTSTLASALSFNGSGGAGGGGGAGNGGAESRLERLRAQVKADRDAKYEEAKRQFSIFKNEYPVLVKKIKDLINRNRRADDEPEFSDADFERGQAQAQLITLFNEREEVKMRGSAAAQASAAEGGSGSAEGSGSTGGAGGRGAGSAGGAANVLNLEVGQCFQRPSNPGSTSAKMITKIEEINVNKGTITVSRWSPSQNMFVSKTKITLQDFLEQNEDHVRVNCPLSGGLFWKNQGVSYPFVSI